MKNSSRSDRQLRLMIRDRAAADSAVSSAKSMMCRHRSSADRLPGLQLVVIGDLVLRFLAALRFCGCDILETMKMRVTRALALTISWNAMAQVFPWIMKRHIEPVRARAARSAGRRSPPVLVARELSW